jgi:GT2 family glycosyltransferase
VASARSLAVQSVLYGNSRDDIERAAFALSNSVGRARTAGLIDSWSLNLGDSSPAAVFDDESLARIRSAVEQHGGTVQYTFFDANLGSAGGHNRLATGSSSELMLILNPDAQVAPDTITTLARAVAGNVGIAEARQVPLEHPKDFTKNTGDTSWASTACALTTRAAFDEIDGFDSETFFLYCDDVDYSWRLRLAGYRVVYEPAATVFHDKRLLVDGNWPASPAEIYYSAEAAMLLAWKYSRGHLASALVKQYRADKNNEAVQKAVAEFESRRVGGRLPVQLDPKHQVGQFIKGNYAVHRF